MSGHLKKRLVIVTRMLTAKRNEAVHSEESEGEKIGIVKWLLDTLRHFTNLINIFLAQATPRIFF